MSLSSIAEASPKLLPWHHAPWQRLTRLATQDQLPHALLLKGPAGVGKATFAMAFAAWLLCGDRRTDGACDACKYCRLLQAGSHPDILRLEPEEAGRAIKVDQVRDLVGWLGRQSQYGGYRVVLIRPAEAMNVAAANALLKVLEEPGRRVVFLLVTDQPHQMLPTVRSRCQALGFTIPDADEARDWLRPRVGDLADTLLALAGGRPLAALGYGEGDRLSRRQRAWNAWILWGRHESDAVGVASEWVECGVSDTLAWLAGWWTDMARLKADPAAGLFDADSRPQLLAMAEQWSPAAIFRAYDAVLGLRGAFARGANLNPQMAFEGLLMAWRSAA